MPLSAATDETRADAQRAGARVVAMPGAAAQDPAAHPHEAHPLAAHAAAHDHASPGHAHEAHGHLHPAAAARPAVRLGPSVLRLSLGGRLVIAGVLIAALWTIVLLVTGGQA